MPEEKVNIAALLRKHRRMKQPRLLWEAGVEIDQSDAEDYARGIGRGLMLAAAELGYRPTDDGWRVDPETHRWCRS